MEKIRFVDKDTDEVVELFVLEETTVSENKYLLVAEDEEGDTDAYIFRYISEDDDEVIYEPVDEDPEYSAILKVFEERLEDSEFVK